MPFRYSMIFNYASTASNGNRRPGGWSESVVHSTGFTENSAAFLALVEARRKLMSSSSSIVGYRCTDMDRKKGTITGRFAKPGTSGALSDLASNTLQLSFTNGPNTLRYQMRGIPDEWTSGGVLTDEAKWRQDFADFHTSLQHFSQRCVNKEAAQVDIDTITDTGLVVFTEALGGTVANDYVNILRTTSALQRTRTKYKISAMSAGNLGCQLVNWDGGNAKGGRIRKVATLLVTYPDGYNVDFLMSKKVGRPFFSTRGRR